MSPFSMPMPTACAKHRNSARTFISATALGAKCCAPPVRRKRTPIVICVDDAGIAKDIVRLVGNKFSNAELLVRAYDRTAAIQLIHMVIDTPVRETFDSGLRLGGAALKAAGASDVAAAEVIADVRRRDEQHLQLQVQQTTEADDDTLEATKKFKPVPI